MGDSSSQQQPHRPQLKLYYFNIVGKGEPIRLLCAHAGIELEDYRFASRDEFHQMQANGQLPFGQVPMLEVVETKDNGQQSVHQLVQSTAILRYLGKLGGLYPTDDLMVAAKIDAALAQEADAFTGATVVTYSTRFGVCLDDDALKKSEALIASEVIPRHLRSLDKLLQESATGWIAGTNEPSPADFAWFVKLTNPPKWLKCDLVDGYPNIKAFVDKFKDLDSIKIYYQSN